ncbi:adenine nucleotide alpha hydrolase [Neptuniibacter sp.]|uniref:adenine nucleotide alpha hydrolase n=1 Tax=Neptuniibacter sp. TaxID=1962643 RepID=UPI0026124916|nr:adenine nucleotide alpha hydrolase [Neptuniibacter sp.]
MKKKLMMSWSTGKDSAWSLHQLQQKNEYELVGLFCTINKKFARTAMHAVRVELLQEQARQIGLPLDIIEIPYPCTNEQYAEIMEEFIDSIKARGVECCAFGDLFLGDIRDYRITQLQGTGIEPVFPLWGSPTDELGQQMIAGGLKTIITCVDPKQLDPSFVGREYTEQFLADLPESVDPCGENGEFHSFVYDAPIFKQPINVRVTEVVEREGFVFADVVSAEA